jgi:hypothetical protein
MRVVQEMSVQQNDRKVSFHKVQFLSYHHKVQVSQVVLWIMLTHIFCSVPLSSCAVLTSTLPLWKHKCK